MRASPTLLILGSFALIPLDMIGAQSSPSTPTAANSLGGIVRDESRAPIPSAELSLLRRGEPARVVRSGNDGRFSFSYVRPGAIALTARRLGYKTAALDLAMDAGGFAGPVEVVMEEIASDIDVVVVEGSKGHLREFYEHKATNSFGKFFDRKDIERKAPGLVSELVRTVPGATLRVSERTGNRILLRGCQPTVWIDGTRAMGAEVDEVARPSDLAGVEVYPSWAGLPAQYQDRDNRMCGVIVLWTRSDR